MRLMVTGAAGFLGWRTATLLAERGHEIVAVTRPGGAARAHAAGLAAHRMDTGAPEARALVAGCDAVLHFAGMPDPARSRADPAMAVRENAGTTLNLLEGCAEHGAGLIYPSSVRAALVPPPDAYAMSKFLGEEVSRAHPARATVVRLTSVFGPGQVTWEGATGAIAAFAARALEGRPIVIPGNPSRTRDFVYVDDLVDGLERLAAQGPWDALLHAGSGTATPLQDAARMVLDAVGGAGSLELPGGTLAPGEDLSYADEPGAARVAFAPRPLAEGVNRYVDWLRAHPAAQGRARA